ncbi:MULTISPECIES: DNA alkylation repair protein [unclassified Yoonia]|uniref:DNA alkylation repair protein n=1 Tax=unclassified Yoonia TaxID=2629118 RepID=UPI002AFEA738|nr:MULTISPECIES: DNA alkylation repair protein [unclassified Yoonia]
MTVDDALAVLGTDPAKAAEMARHHKVDRAYLGVTTPAIDAVAKGWRETLDLEARLALAADLWASDVHEGRIAAAKLLTQARIRPDDSAAWDMIASWVPECDGPAIADQVAIAGQKRLVADPARFDALAPWVKADHLWTRAAVLALTLPWTKQNNPKATDLALRDRALDWAGQLAGDPHKVIQTALVDWLASLAKHDPATAQAFVDRHATVLKPYALKSARHRLG